jgi:hemerythrin-like domain-containing protein
VSERGQGWLVAWDRELTAAHQRLRQALRVARDEPGGRAGRSVGADLALYCQGFCAALGGHHGGEDTRLFPELSARYPALRPAIAKLEQDHELIAGLLGELDRALGAAAPPDELARHLDGLAAIMDCHFQFEERQLLGVLATLELDAAPRKFLGPL